MKKQMILIQHTTNILHFILFLHQIFVLSKISPTLCSEVEILQPQKFDLFTLTKIKLDKFFTHELALILPKEYNKNTQI